MRLTLTPQLLKMLEVMQRQQKLFHTRLLIGPGKRTIHSLHARLAKNRAGPRKPIIIPENQRRGFVPLERFRCYRGTGATP
jgi:hypothetical protein